MTVSELTEYLKKHSDDTKVTIHNHELIQCDDAVNVDVSKDIVTDEEEFVSIVPKNE